MKGNKNAVAETIENNVRRKIMKERLNDPAFYEKMSALLDEVIKFRKERAEEYEQYLKQHRRAGQAGQGGCGRRHAGCPQGKRWAARHLQQPEGQATGGRGRRR